VYADIYRIASSHHKKLLEEGKTGSQVSHRQNLGKVFSQAQAKMFQTEVFAALKVDILFRKMHYRSKSIEEEKSY